jgi:hypothetical protein
MAQVVTIRAVCAFHLLRDRLLGGGASKKNRYLVTRRWAGLASDGEKVSPPLLTVPAGLATPQHASTRSGRDQRPAA